jgi:hypothetical protein
MICEQQYILRLSIPSKSCREIMRTALDSQTAATAIYRKIRAVSREAAGGGSHHYWK